MTDETKPNEHPTTKLPQTEILNARLQQIIDGQASARSEADAQRKETSEALARLAANVELVSKDVGSVKDRVSIIERWRDEFDSRAARASTGLRTLDARTSKSDLDQDAKLAGLQSELVAAKARNDKLEAETATKKDLDTLKTSLAKATEEQTSEILKGVVELMVEGAKSPLGRKIGYALGLLVLQAITFGTAYLAMKGQHSWETSSNPISSSATASSPARPPPSFSSAPPSP